MKSWILIISYLWKDTCSRWLEQPGSPLARWFVTTLMVGVATVILISLHLLERSVRERLERFGVNTLLVRETLTANDPEFLAFGQRAERLTGLAELGATLRLRQLFVRAQTEWQDEMPVLSYGSVPPGMLAGMFSPITPLLCLSGKLPENVLVEVKVQRRTGIAMVRRPGEQLRSISDANLLLVPQGWLAEEESLGHIDTLIFQRRPEAPGMQQIIEAAQAVFAVDRRTAQFQSAEGMLREWERLKERQQQSRALLAAVMGLSLALVFGSIAVLEFRQNLFVTALLRSFGLPAGWLWLRQWIESATLANLAAVSAIGVLWHFHSAIFLSLGFPVTVVRFDGPNPYWSSEIGMILLFVNAGALLSSLPVAIGLRRAVGRTLS